MSQIRVGALAFAVAWCGMLNYTRAAIVQWQIADGGNGHYYEFVEGSLTWPAAKVAAEASSYLGLTGHLATLTSSDENTFVFDHLLPSTAYEAGAWIGLTDDETFGGHESFGRPNPQIDGWLWITGEPVAFTAWNSFTNSNGDFVQTPNNMDNEDYALFLVRFGNPVWDDQRLDYTAPLIVEYEPAQVPEPTTVAIWGSLCLVRLFAGWQGGCKKEKAS